MVKKIFICIFLYFTIFALTSCGVLFAPSFVYKSTILINEEVLENDIFIQTEYVYQKSSGSSYVNLYPRFSKGILTGASGFVNIDTPEHDDEKIIAIMCQKLNVTREKYFELYDRVKQKRVYSEFTVYTMQRVVNRDEPYGMQELVVVIERENEINVFRKEISLSEFGVFLYPNIKRDDGIVYITKYLAFDVTKNMIIKATYNKTEYADSFNSISDMFKHTGTLILDDSRLSQYIDYDNYVVKFLFEHEKNIYAFVSSKKVNIFIVYLRDSEKIVYSELIDTGVYGCGESLPKIMIDGKLTDPFCSY